MRFSNAYRISLVAVLGALIPTGMSAAAPLPTSPPINVSAAARPDAVRVSGTIAGAPQLQAVLYATFAPELPTVLVSRRPLKTDAGGHFDATISIAPAFFSGTIITVIVQTAAGALVGQSSITITDPPAAGPTPTANPSSSHSH
jgi:hypothetical protein